MALRPYDPNAFYQTHPVELPSYAVSELPSPSPAAQMIYVSDETGGSIPAFSDGSNWRRMSDRAIVA